MRLEGSRSDLDLVATSVVTRSLLVEVERRVASVVQRKRIERRRTLEVRRVSVRERTTLVLRGTNPL